jgi:hypothetical protein
LTHHQLAGRHQRRARPQRQRFLAALLTISVISAAAAAGSMAVGPPPVAAAVASDGVCPTGATRPRIGDGLGASRGGGTRKHQGVDLFAPRDTSLHAVTAGTVQVDNLDNSNAGLSVVLRGDDGITYNYFHNQRNVVQSGARVHAGQHVADLGASGNAKGGEPHLHFEMWRGRELLDPVPPARHWCTGAPLPGDPPVYDPFFRAIAATRDGQGYWLASREGGVYAYGNARFDNSLPGLGVRVDNITAMEADVDGRGYWLVGRDGGVFALEAGFYGSLPGHGVEVGNIRGIAATPSGRGYWLVGADGGVFALGDAGFYGSLPGLNVRVDNIVGISATTTGQGYWLVGADGGVFAFGDARFEGSLPSIDISRNDVTGIAADPDGNGYWLAAADGAVYSFAAEFHGRVEATLNRPVTGIEAVPTGGGYWLVAGDGGVFARGSAPFHGSGVQYDRP